ncbi:hypothetical protein F5X96DRAFT_638477 [Biscogniauxia mediterranea]|nr:hypothetical protein F5X96DRAFT_638477 [Biscogniauxia mediterranea]
MAPARLAQSVERETLNLKVAGSTPASGSIPDASLITVGASFFFFSIIFVFRPCGIFGGAFFHYFFFHPFPSLLSVSGGFPWGQILQSFSLDYYGVAFL